MEFMFLLKTVIKWMNTYVRRVVSVLGKGEIGEPGWEGRRGPGRGSLIIGVVTKGWHLGRMQKTLSEESEASSYTGVCSVQRS